MADSKEPNQVPTPGAPMFASGEKITKVNVAEEIKNSFLDYSMSVIISRALAGRAGWVEAVAAADSVCDGRAGGDAEPEAFEVRADRG
jgi:hypothetical protein